MRVGLDRPFVKGDDLERISAYRRDRCAALIEVVGGVFDGAKEIIEDVQRTLGIVRVTQRLGAAQAALTGVIAGLLGGLVALDGLLIAAAGEERLGQVEMGHRTAIGQL